MALEGEIKTPFGQIKKKTAVIGGVSAAAIIGIVWYRSRTTAPAPLGDTTSGSTTDTGIDPATGIPYADENQLDSSSLVTGNGQVIGYDGSGSPIYGAGSGVGIGGVSTGTGPGSFTSNAQWAQYAEDYMVNTVGGDPNTIGNALGKYIAGQALSADQVQVVQQAIAFAGNPPVSGNGGFPPSYRTSGGSGGGNGGHPKTAKNPVTGLKVITHGNTSISIGWNPSPGATGYKITGAGHAIFQEHMRI